MREIKFRAWKRDLSKMVDVGCINFPSKTNDWFWGFTQGNDDTLGHNFILLQYTGLKDKNGNEIYEGDVCEEGSYIDWCNECVGFQPHYNLERKYCHRCSGNYEISDVRDELEIIGNIYENPKLLK